MKYLCKWWKETRWKEKRIEINPKTMLKRRKKGKSTKDKIHFNGSAVNHTARALWRETHKGKGKRKEHKEQKQPCTSNILVNITRLGIISIILLLYIILLFLYNTIVLEDVWKSEAIWRRVSNTIYFSVVRKNTIGVWVTFTGLNWNVSLPALDPSTPSQKAV